VSVVLSTYLKVKLMNSDQITTAASVIKAAAIVLGIIGINVSPESQTIIIEACGGVMAVATLVHGWFTNKKVN